MVLLLLSTEQSPSFIFLPPANSRPAPRLLTTQLWVSIEEPQLAQELQDQQCRAAPGTALIPAAGPGLGNCPLLQSSPVLGQRKFSFEKRKYNLCLFYYSVTPIKLWQKLTCLL